MQIQVSGIFRAYILYKQSQDPKYQEYTQVDNI